MHDVVVVGGGNAGLVAAISAREAGASVLLLERAPRWQRGGNSRHTRDIRYAHAPGEPYTTGEAYPTEELLQDLLSVGGRTASQTMAELVIEESQTVAEWMSQHGVRWQQPLTGTLHLGRTNRFFLGGGKALVNTYYQMAERLGIEIHYEAAVTDVTVQDGVATGVVLGDRPIEGRAVVLTSGGFEANIEWLKRYWGDAADNYVVRGTPHNDGRVLSAMLDKGACTAGDPKGFHAVAVDARAPKFDGGIATRLDSVPFGIVVNKPGRRFYDEGQDFWPKRYAIWGRLIAEQPEQIAYSIVDAPKLDRFLTSLFAALAILMGDSGGLTAASVGPGAFYKVVPYSAMVLPFLVLAGYALRPGVTFTYLGLAVDEYARVRTQQGTLTNVYAAGEIMSGNVLSSGYLGGFGLTIGTVFGRMAGGEAAKHAAN